MNDSPQELLKDILITPIGLIKSELNDDEIKGRKSISKIVINKNLTKALDGIEDFSHIYVIFWMNKIKNTAYLHHPKKLGSKPSGIFATRAPIHANPIGLTLVELINREENILMVRGLDAFNDTPILDIKPYPDWEQGYCIVVNDFKVPKWLKTKKLDYKEYKDNI